MAMNYTESSNLMNDVTFRGRVKCALLKFADSIENEPKETTAHNTRLKWATITMQQPDQRSAEYTPPVVMDAAVQSAGAAIDDAALQGAVEAVVQKLL